MSFPRIAAAALAFAAMCSSAAAADDEPLLVARLPEGREVPLVLLSTDGEGTVRLLTWKRGAQERRQWLAMPASARGLAHPSRGPTRIAPSRAPSDSAKSSAPTRPKLD